MSSEWISTTIGQLITLQRGHDLPAQDRVKGNVPIMGSAGITGYHDRATTKGPGVVVGRSGVGSMGVVSYICRDYWALNTTLFVKDFKGNDERFIYYLLKTVNFRQFDTGSAQASLNRNVVYPHKVSIPSSLEEQRRIAKVLVAIEDRITLLRETNTTLEGVALALFKSWFVDFDPVRAKAEGRAPEGMDEATMAIFPDSLENSELGLVPRGWAICSLDQHVSAERGLSYKGAGLAERGQGVPMHNLNSVLEGGGYKYPGIKFYNGVFKDKHLVNSGEIIVANTEQGHEHRLIGFPAIVPRAYSGTAIFSHHIYRVRLLDGSPLSMSFLYRTLMTPAVREQIIGCANGSTVNMLKVVGLQTPKFVCPSFQVCKAYELIASPIQAAIEANVERVDALANLRDTLLPRLISGQLKITGG